MSTNWPWWGGGAVGLALVTIGYTLANQSFGVVGCGKVARVLHRDSGLRARTVAVAAPDWLCAVSVTDAFWQDRYGQRANSYRLARRSARCWRCRSERAASPCWRLSTALMRRTGRGDCRPCRSCAARDPAVPPRRRWRGVRWRESKDLPPGRLPGGGLTNVHPAAAPRNTAPLQGARLFDLAVRHIRPWRPLLTEVVVGSVAERSGCLTPRRGCRTPRTRSLRFPGTTSIPSTSRRHPRIRDSVALFAGRTSHVDSPVDRFEEHELHVSEVDFHPGRGAV
jgi:hypothetical protein